MENLKQAIVTNNNMQMKCDYGELHLTMVYWSSNILEGCSASYAFFKETILYFYLIPAIKIGSGAMLTCSLVWIEKITG
jgi:hypothetical protein